MEQVFQFIAKYWIELILGVATVFNMVMALINAAKAGRCVKYSEVISVPDIQQIVETVKTLTNGEKIEFFSQLQKAMEDEKNGISKT